MKEHEVLRLKAVLVRRMMDKKATPVIANEMKQSSPG
jgi:hypothetical protein